MTKTIMMMIKTVMIMMMIGTVKSCDIYDR